jgi:hypothetical protein
MPSRRVFLFAWDMLRLAWIKHKAVWLADRKKVKAKNRGYYTHSVAIPTQELLRAVASASVIQL